MSRKRIDKIKKVSITPDEFFKKVSANCNYLDDKIVRDVYYATIRAASQELRDRKVINLPDFMLLRLEEQAPRKVRNVNTGLFCMLPAMYKIVSVFDYKIKKYFSSLRI